MFKLWVVKSLERKMVPGEPRGFFPCRNSTIHHPPWLRKTPRQRFVDHHSTTVESYSRPQTTTSPTASEFPTEKVVQIPTRKPVIILVPDSFFLVESRAKKLLGALCLVILILVYSLSCLSRLLTTNTFFRIDREENSAAGTESNGG
jgi:hypothetical protein